MNMTGRDTLYYMAGNTIKRVQQQYKTWKALQECDHFANHSYLQNLKDYTGDSLVKCNDALFLELFIPAENLFCHYEEHDLLESKEIKARHKAEMIPMQKVPNLELPTCHNIERNFIVQFFKLKLHRYVKTQ